MTVNNVAVMRRRKDSWLNATQILKVAGIDKGKRTKLLEKEILTGEHEKVQGGYGKYQGTWISFDTGVAFCKKYGVHELLAPLLYFDENAAGGPDSTPTKEQAMAARRKQMYASGLNQSNGMTSNIFPQISSTITQALTSVAKSKPDAPSLSRSSTAGRIPLGTISPIKRSVTQDSEHGFIPPRLSQDPSFTLTQPDSAYSSQLPPPPSQDMEPPRKRARASPAADDANFANSVPASQDLSASQATLLAPPSTVPEDDSENDILALQPNTNCKPVQPLNVEDFDNADHIQHLLMNLFVSAETALQSLEHIPPPYIDLPIDASGSAAIHWASSLAMVPLLKGLVQKGANIFRVNLAGETALMRGCFVTNNFDNNTFPQLLAMLHPTIPLADKNGRTILHHIAVKSGMKGRSQDSRYYLECLLEFIVRHPSSFSTGSGNSIGFAKFLADVVNARDSNGDTALNIAARIGNKDIIQQLLDIGADSNIPNRAGLRPTDFGVGGEPDLRRENSVIGRVTVPEGVVEKSRDIVESMQSLITSIDSDFQTEILQKQTQIESTLSQLREASARCNEQTRRLERLRELRAKRDRLTQYASTLRRELETERGRVEKVNGTTVLPPSIPSTLPDSPSALPSVKELSAWLSAYRTNAYSLNQTIGNLQLRSTELEEKYRRVVAICTDVEPEQVDALLESLVQAVESDPRDVDTGRVRSFLRKVEEGG